MTGRVVRCGDVDCPCQQLPTMVVPSGMDTLVAVHARAVRAEQRADRLAAELAALRGARPDDKETSQ